MGPSEAEKQEWFLTFGPTLQLAFARNCGVGRAVLFGTGEPDRASLCRVPATVAIVVRVDPGDDVAGVSNVERAVRTTKDIHPRHSDDDGIVRR